MSAAPSASAAASSAAVVPVRSAAHAVSSVWALVPPREPYQGGFAFHPSLPLAGQYRGDGRCDVWALDTKLYRGDVDASVCKGWRPPPPEVPPSLAAQIPRVPDASNDEIVSAWSPDRKRLALGRIGSRQVRLWDATTLALLHTLELPDGKPDDGPPKLTDLEWMGTAEIAVAAPDGVLLWSPEVAGSALRPLPNGPEAPVTFLSADPAGRYLGYGTHQQGPRGDDLDGSEVISLATGKELLSGRRLNSNHRTVALEDPPVYPVLWSSTGDTVYAVRQSEFATTYREEWSVQLIGLDARHHRLDSTTIELSEYRELSPSPDGSSLAWVMRKWEEYPGETGANAPHTTQLQAMRWSPEGHLVEAWSVPSEGEVLAWSPGSNALAVVEDTHVTAYDAADGKVKGRWKGYAPLAWSPDSRQLAHANADGALVVVRPGAKASKPLLSGVHALAWGDGQLAAASDSAVTFLATDSWSPARTVAQADVVSIVFDAPHHRWLLRDGQRRIHVDEAGKTELLTTTVAGATVQPTPAGEVLVIEPLREKPHSHGAKDAPVRIRRFVRAASGWAEQPTEVLAEGESVDPTGRLTVTIRNSLARVRRLGDGEVLNVDGMTAWTDRLAHDGHADKAREPWTLRKGDAVTGTFVQGEAVVALAPRVPDLWSQFWSGKALPGL